MALEAVYEFDLGMGVRDYLRELREWARYHRMWEPAGAATVTVSLIEKWGKLKPDEQEFLRGLLSKSPFVFIPGGPHVYDSTSPLVGYWLWLFETFGNYKSRG